MFSFNKKKDDSKGKAVEVDIHSQSSSSSYDLPDPRESAATTSTSNDASDATQASPKSGRKVKRGVSERLASAVRRSFGLEDKRQAYLAAEENWAKPGTYDEQIVNVRLHEYRELKKKKGGKTPLNVSSLQLQQVPAELGKVFIDDAADLERVDLSENGLVELPQQVAAMNKLREFQLHNNALVKLPQAFAALLALEELYLGWNSFAEFPRVVSRLPKLRVLSLAWNAIEDVPDEDLARMRTLERLDLSNNKLTEFPETISELENLHSLVLSGNRLQSLPGSLTDLTKLTHLRLLDLGSNELPHKKLMILAETLDDVKQLRTRIGKHANDSLKHSDSQQK